LPAGGWVFRGMQIVALRMAAIWEEMEAKLTDDLTSQIGKEEMRIFRDSRGVGQLEKIETVIHLRIAEIQYLIWNADLACGGE
jgi:hypothetical protein